MTDEVETPAPEETLEIAEAGSEEVEIEDATTSPDESDSEEKPKKSGVQKRINELTRQRYEAEQARKEAIDQAAELQRKLDEQAILQAQQQRQGQEPRLEDYDYDHDQWAAAYKNWVDSGIEETEKARASALQQQQQQQEALQRQAEIRTKVLKAQEKYPDYFVKINDPSLPDLASINQTAYEALMDSDMMGELSYYLASNPAEVYDFSSMSPIQAVKKIAKLESTLSSSKSVSQAPEPAPSTSGKGEAVKDPSKMSIDEWMEWRNANL